MPSTPLQQLVHPNRCNERRRHHHQGRFYEKIVAVPLDFVQITSPLPPNHKFGQHVQLFSDIEIQDLRVSLGLKILDNLCNI